MGKWGSSYGAEISLGIAFSWVWFMIVLVTSLYSSSSSPSTADVISSLLKSLRGSSPDSPD